MKALSILVGGITALSAFPKTAAAGQTELTAVINGVGYTYQINDDGKTAVIISAAVPSSVKETVVPEKIEEYSVVSISEKAYMGSLTLEKLTIPPTVNSIGEQAFMSCNELKEVTIGEGITAIPNDCFFSCPNLVTVNMPDTLTSIGSEAFFGCDKLDTEIPPSVTSIGKDALGMEADFHSQGSIAVQGFLIKGTVGSCAEKYALENNIDFIDLNNFTSGDVNGDEAVDSSDASDVLIEYSAISTGTPPRFTPKQQIVGDLNGDGVIDSSDAAEILIIYAKNSTIR
ncbi:MAG: leucine-rich repeat protein [Ruminococcus sp.]|nr:leucine-rich repeat protein [Ruminococcus sp.]